MKILIACEFSGIARESFRAKGHDAWSCDLLPTERPGQHIQDDVLKHLDDGWDMMIAHPPCTYLANSGVQHLHKDPQRWVELQKARYFFMKILSANISKIAVENPVPHKYAGLPDYAQIIHPYYFGEEAMKKTCLWLKNLPLLQHTDIVGQGKKYIGKDGRSNGSAWYQLPPSSDRWKYRSRSFESIANAMAEQWNYW